jgi:hypothetical protein
MDDSELWQTVHRLGGKSEGRKIVDVGAYLGSTSAWFLRSPVSLISPTDLARKPGRGKGSNGHEAMTLVRVLESGQGKAGGDSTDQDGKPGRGGKGHGNGHRPRSVCMWPPTRSSKVEAIADS